METSDNGIKTEDFTFNKHPGDYLLFFGRIHHDKGTAEAIEIAQRAGMKLIISGIIQDQEYYEEKVAPFINGDDIVFTGPSGPKERDRLLGGAYALLHPINFEEPFGLSVAESMLCGTPVIAFNRGSMPELINHEKTGLLVTNTEEAVDAVTDVKRINRSDCREWSESNFSQERMIDRYLEVYRQILHES